MSAVKSHFHDEISARDLPDERGVVDLLPETRAFLRDWLDWVERGAPDYDPYVRWLGLCNNARRFDRSHAITENLQDYFAGECFPFGEQAFIRSVNNNTMHECPKRLAFARANASAPA